MSKFTHSPDHHSLLHIITKTLNHLLEIIFGRFSSGLLYCQEDCLLFLFEVTQEDGSLLASCLRAQKFGRSVHDAPEKISELRSRHDHLWIIWTLQNLLSTYISNSKLTIWNCYTKCCQSQTECLFSFTWYLVRMVENRVMSEIWKISNFPWYKYSVSLHL